MPTIANPASKYATMSAAQVLDEQNRQLARWAQEDAERRARHAAILASL